MGEVTLTVPAEYAGAFRDAVLVEIRQDAERVASAVEELQRHQFSAAADAERARFLGEATPEPRKLNIGDVRGGCGSIRQDINLVEQAVAAEPGEAIEVAGDDEALAYAFETMADKVLAPKLAEEVNTSPIGDNAERITQLTRAIDWAVGESKRLNDQWREAADKAGAA